MKIDSGTIGMESARNYRAMSATVRRFTTKKDFSLQAAIGDDAQNTQTGTNGQDITDAKDSKEREIADPSEQKGLILQDWQARIRSIHDKISTRTGSDTFYENFRQQAIQYIFNLLFGKKDIQEIGKSDAAEAPKEALTEAPTETVEQVGIRTLSYTSEYYYEEQETTSFASTGTVRTSDGREITFNLNIEMSRQFQEYYREDLKLANFKMCDPLVINLDTDVTELEDQTFLFDIDADGEEDLIHGLGAGSGYLSLDKNGDGVINDGSELFGTASGDGFEDLALYDEDGNGWIDENDSVFDKLKIWTKDENGRDVLYKLADKGVGAICLQNASTDFGLRGGMNQVMGAIRKTGIFLYENGNVGTVSHVDVAKYQAYN